MKKKMIGMALVAFVLSSVLAACSNSTDVYDPNANAKDTHEAFKQAFVAEFGQPSANQDWGFNETTRSVTRAGSLTDEDIVSLGEGIVDLSVDELKELGFKRIIAEDLAVSAGSDFDYNDIVFDAKRIKEAGTGDYATFYLIVRATGAYKQIYVGDSEAEGRFEVHELFGVAQETFVNTANKDKAKDQGAYWANDHAPVFVELKVKKTGASEPSLIDIPIYVENNQLPLTAKRGQPAEKLCVDTDFSWVTEKTKMRDWYPVFQHYVVGEEPETSWWHSTYWDGNESVPDEYGTATYITVNGKQYVITFEQEGVKDGVLKFATEKPITIRAFEIGSDNSRTQIDLDGTSNKIGVLCTGNHSHFARSINYDSTDKAATLITPEVEKTIVHAPVQITLTINGKSTTVKSTINIWPTYYLNRY